MVYLPLLFVDELSNRVKDLVVSFSNFTFDRLADFQMHYLFSYWAGSEEIANTYYNPVIQGLCWYVFTDLNHKLLPASE